MPDRPLSRAPAQSESLPQPRAKPPPATARKPVCPKSPFPHDLLCSDFVTSRPIETPQSFAIKMRLRQKHPPKAMRLQGRYCVGYHPVWFPTVDKNRGYCSATCPVLPLPLAPSLLAANPDQSTTSDFSSGQAKRNAIKRNAPQKASTGHISEREPPASRLQCSTKNAAAPFSICSAARDVSWWPNLAATSKPRRLRFAKISKCCTPTVWYTVLTEEPCPPVKVRSKTPRFARKKSFTARKRCGSRRPPRRR